MGLIDLLFGAQTSPAVPQSFLSPDAAQNRVGVFVSYNHRDIKIADALMETLTAPHAPRAHWSGRQQARQADCASSSP
jgi:hypothetical protein